MSDHAAVDTRFQDCVDYVYHDGGGSLSIDCKLGLWCVSGPIPDRVESEAFYYWLQYFSDGEYNDLISKINNKAT
jgi:hypothetical protein